MKVTVVLFSCIVPIILSHPLKEVRRQFQYTTNVVHENPNFPDQAAQSSVKVNFNPGNQIEVRPTYNTNPYQGQPQLQPQLQPQNYPTNAPHQLFNVGYSVRFTGEKPKIPKYSRPTNFDNGEIITGTRKQNEAVQGPNINLSPQDFVATALLNKKQKISGIKANPQYITSFENPKTLISQANLSPNTQKFYQALEQAKTQVPNNEVLHQKYSWTNLGPNTEIIRSTELPSALHFDHAKALGRSQDFDHSNAIDVGGNPQPQPQQYQNVYQPQASRVQQLQQLPLDTTLLREPVHIDTRYMEEVMRKLYQEQAGTYAQPFQQPYRTIPVQETPESDPAYQQYQPEQTRYQYKIYGKPQPVTVDEDQAPRQPRFVDLDTNLRPPPFGNGAYQRRILLG